MMLSAYRCMSKARDIGFDKTFVPLYLPFLSRDYVRPMKGGDAALLHLKLYRLDPAAEHCGVIGKRHRRTKAIGISNLGPRADPSPHCSTRGSSSSITVPDCL